MPSVQAGSLVEDPAWKISKAAINHEHLKQPRLPSQLRYDRVKFLVSVRY